MKPHLWTTLWSQVYSLKRPILWITLAACMVRVPFLWLKSGDYIDYLHPWFEQIKQNGGLNAIGMPVGNYMVSYIYLLALLTYLPLPDLFSIKLVSITGDVVLAWFCMKLAGKAAPGPGRTEQVYGMILFLPTVVLNSSAWGQCDSLYTAALLAFLYFLSENDSNRAAVSLSIAFCLKLQTVFLAPVVLIAVCQRMIRIRSLIFFPLIYGLTIFPRTDDPLCSSSLYIFFLIHECSKFVCLVSVAVRKQSPGNTGNLPCRHLYSRPCLSGDPI